MLNLDLNNILINALQCNQCIVLYIQCYIYFVNINVTIIVITVLTVIKFNLAFILIVELI